MGPTEASEITGNLVITLEDGSEVVQGDITLTYDKA